MTLTPVPPGQIATIVTTLEMLKPPGPRAVEASALRVVRWPTPDAEKYRALYRRVGTPWLWFSRLLLSDEALLGIIRDPKVEVYALIDRHGIELGILELDFRIENNCELSFFGLVPELAGKGHGRWLMNEALRRAWAPGITRVWVHTCALDHPSALEFYRRSGFVPISIAVETFPDPRLNGIFPRDVAPQVPLIELPSSAASRA